jgi:kelch-like protein 31
MKESKQNYVELKGFGNALGVNAMLDYIYTGALSISFENILWLLDASSRLQLNDAIGLCSEFLIKSINVSNCVSILRLADTYSLGDVAELAKQYLCENVCDVYRTSFEQFYQLSYEQLYYLLNSDSLQSCCTELDLFSMIVRWIDGPQSTHNNNFTNPIAAITTTTTTTAAIKEERIKCAPELIKSIRFMCMSPEELADHVECVEFMSSMSECSKLLLNAYKYYALPKRQPLVASEQTKLRNSEMLVAVGENHLFVLNEKKRKWEVACQAPLEDNYREYRTVIRFHFNSHLIIFI